MKPEAEAFRVLSTTRSKAKMYEFGVPEEDHIALRTPPHSLFSLAIGILGDTAAAISDEFLEWPSFEVRLESKQNTMFSAVFFDAYLNANLDETISNEFSLFCSVAYYLAEAPGSSRVVIKNIVRPELDVSEGLAALAFDLLSENRHNDYAGSRFSQIEHSIRNEFFGYYDGRSNAAQLRHILAYLRDTAYGFGSSEVLFYTDIVIAIVSRKLSTSARYLLPFYSGIAERVWNDALQKENFPTELWPAQQRICEFGLLQGASCVVQMPTSAGKTRATELIIRSAFMAERTQLAVIVAPFRSLCHDIRNDLTVAFTGEDVVVTEASDTYLLDVDVHSFSQQKTIMILTPEKLLYLLKREASLSGLIRLVIYDEGHQFDSPSRGPNYELLLTYLKIQLDVNTQIILISAVIENASSIAQWLVGNSDAVLTGEGLLPTVKRIAFASWQHARGFLQYVSPNDPEQKEFFVPKVIERQELNLIGRERKQRYFPEATGVSVGLYFGLKLAENGGVALFCGQKSSASKLCRTAVDLFRRDPPFDQPVRYSDANEIQRIYKLFCRHLGTDSGATQCSKLGILPHHSNIPQGLRLAIEHAMKFRMAKFVLCTSTLAQGVNLPIKYLIVSTTQQGREAISGRDFQNLMGRAGRAGMHTEGTVIFSSPEIFDQKTDRWQNYRWNETKKLISPNNESAIQSAILQCLSNYSQRGDIGTRQELQLPIDWLVQYAFLSTEKAEKLLNDVLTRFAWIDSGAFLANLKNRIKAIECIASFILSNVDLDDERFEERIDGLVENTLAYFLATDEKRRDLVQFFRAIGHAISYDTSDQQQRIIIGRSALPPRAALHLKSWLSNEVVTLGDAIENDRFLDVVWDEILPLVNSDAIVKLSQPELLIRALKLWQSRESYAEVHLLLKEHDVRRGKQKITIEQVVDLCESGFSYEVSMILATLCDFSEELENRALITQFTLLQRQIKTGLNNQSAISFLEAGFTDRYVSQQLAESFPLVSNRHEVINVVRVYRETVEKIIEDYPSYFSEVLKELLI